MCTNIELSNHYEHPYQKKTSSVGYKYVIRIVREINQVRVFFDRSNPPRTTHIIQQPMFHDYVRKCTLHLVVGSDSASIAFTHRCIDELESSAISALISAGSAARASVSLQRTRNLRLPCTTAIETLQASFAIQHPDDSRVLLMPSLQRIRYCNAINSVRRCSFIQSWPPFRKSPFTARAIGTIAFVSIFHSTI